MRFRDFRTAEGATAGAVARLLPELTPAAVLLTDDHEGAVELLAATLSAPGALEDPESARRALARQVLGRARWPAGQILETSAPGAPEDDDVALAAALRVLPDGQRAAVVLGLLAAPTPTPGVASGEAGTAATRLMADLARRDEGERHERGRTA